MQAFFGVFDGHGGRKAADYAAEHLVLKIADAMESSQEGEGSIEAAVRSGYLAADAEFLQRVGILPLMFSTRTVAASFPPQLYNLQFWMGLQLSSELFSMYKSSRSDG